MVRSKIIFLTAILVMPLYKGVSSVPSSPDGELIPCLNGTVQVLQTTANDQITDLGSGINDELLCGDILTNDPKMSLSIKNVYESHVTSFCKKNKYKKYCDQFGESLDYKEIDLSDAFLKYISEESSNIVSVKSKATLEVPVFICYNIKSKLLKERIINKSLSIKERKSAIDELMNIVPDRMAPRFVSLITRYLRSDNKIAKGELTQYISKKLAKIYLPNANENDQEINKDIANFLHRTIQDNSFGEPIRLAVLTSLYDSAKKGNKSAKAQLINLTSVNNEPIKAKALDYIELLEEMTGTTVAIDYLAPPKCSKWDENRINDALILNSNDVGSLSNFFQNKYKKNIKLSINNEDDNGGDKLSTYEIFFQEVESVFDGSEKQKKWQEFVNGYDEYSTASKEEDKITTDFMYCRMKKLQVFQDILTDANASSDEKLKILKLIPLLSEHDRGAFMNDLVVHSNDKKVLKEAIKTLTEMNTQDSVNILEKIYHKDMINLEMKVSILNAFKQPSINLLLNSKILSKLKSNSSSPSSQIQLKILQKILLNKKKQEEKEQKLEGLADQNLEDFIRKVQEDHLSNEVKDLSLDEATTMSENFKQKISELTALKEQLELLKAQADSSSNSVTIEQDIMKLNDDIKNYGERLYNAKLQAKLLKLKEGMDNCGYGGDS
ncbi:MAG: hypothetical protein HN576_04495 [Bacteriovoracaceae bacterium]|nr:hypothetical protein [Bacteriovoracaceae bacterium]